MSLADERAALMRGILESPEDDTARLVFADWLDDNATTDQDRARAEWIRISCAPRKKSTGPQRRIAGERAWLGKNAFRLWPNLFALKAHWWPTATHKTLLTGRIVLSLALAVPRDVGSGERIVYTRVNIQAERGIATEISVCFVRAAMVAPFAALDEPFAKLRFLTIPERCYEFGNGVVFVCRRPFAMRGLGDVWQEIEGGEHALVDDQERAWEFPQPNVVFNTKHVDVLINEALTKWARHESKNPLRTGAA